MCIESDHGSMEMRRCLSTFMALYTGGFGNTFRIDVIHSNVFSPYPCHKVL